MTRRKGVPVLFALALVATASLPAGCRGCDDRSDEERILDLVHESATMAQEHDISGLMDITTRWFTASPGNRERKEVRQILLVAFQRYGNFRIAYPEPSIHVAPDGLSAKAKVPFVILREGLEIPDLGDLAGDPEGWVQEVSMTADPYRLELWLVKEDGDWLVDRARVQGIRSMDSF